MVGEEEEGEVGVDGGDDGWGGGGNRARFGQSEGVRDGGGGKGRAKESKTKKCRRSQAKESVCILLCISKAVVSRSSLVLCSRGGDGKEMWLQFLQSQSSTRAACRSLLPMARIGCQRLLSCHNPCPAAPKLKKRPCVRARSQRRRSLDVVFTDTKSYYM